MAEGENISRADAETLLLARDKGSELLVDEKTLSTIAQMLEFKIWNTWTVLLESLSMGYIEVSDKKQPLKS